MNPHDIKDYDPEHKCQTPGSIYSVWFRGKTISVSVMLPFVPWMSEAEANALEAQLHYAVEGVVAQLFKSRTGVEL